jgi:hypothetical protein
LFWLDNFDVRVTNSYLNVLWLCTACGQKWFRFRHLPYIFHIKPFIFITFSWSHSLLDFHEIFSIKCRNKYTSSYNLQIILFLLSLKHWFKNKVKFFHQILLYNHINCDVKNLHLCLNHKCLQIKVRKNYMKIFR